MDVATIRQRTVRNALFGSAGFACTYLLRIVQAILLARLLTAEDYGLFAVVGVFGTLGLAVGTGGFQAWLVQLPGEPTEQEKACGFWGQLLLGVMAAGVLVLLTPLIVRHYQLPAAASWALALCGLNTLLFALTANSAVSMSRALRQDQLAVIELIAALAAVVVTLLLAALQAGYWALISGMLVQTAIARISVLVLYPYPPPRLVPLAELRSALPVAISEQMAKLVPVLIDCWPPFVVGAVLGLEALGIVNWSRGIVGFLLAATVVLRTTYRPALSRLSHSPQDFSDLLSQAVRTLNAGSLVVLPLALFALPIVFEPLFSARWLPALPLMQLLLLANYVAALAALASLAVFAMGRSVDRLAISGLCVGCCWLGGTWMLHRLGIMAAPLTFLVIHVIEGLLCWAILWRHKYFTSAATGDAAAGIAALAAVVAAGWWGGWAIESAIGIPRDYSNLAAAAMAIAAVEWHALRRGRLGAVRTALILRDRWRRRRDLQAA